MPQVFNQIELSRNWNTLHFLVPLANLNQAHDIFDTLILFIQINPSSIHLLAHLSLELFSQVMCLRS